jgi:site-specific DNA-methyltransferase (adenine-specific)
VISINRVECIDCMIGMEQFPNQYFDWVIADIPYGIDVANMPYTQYQGKGVKQKSGSTLALKKEKYELMDWDKQTPPQAYFDEVRRVSKNQIIFGIEYVDWTGVGKGRIRWNKMVPDKMSFKSYEIVYCSAIDYEMQIDLLWSGMRQAKSAKTPTIMQGDKRLNEKRIHPTHKPRILYEILYQSFCETGCRILDTHLGGGSSRIVAHKMGYEFYGFEINEYYFTRQEERFLKETKMPLFD